VLITLGVIFLLRTTGVIAGEKLHYWFVHYWPLLLILWGVAKLAEHFWARHRGEPTPRLGAGGIVFLVFFIMIASGVTATSDWDWGRLNWNWGNGDFDFFNPHYDFNENFDQALAGGTQIKVLCNRGDISVSASNDNQAHVVMHKSVRARSQEDANRTNETIHPRFIQQGGIWLLDLTVGDFERVQFGLDLQLPRQIALSLSTHRGNLSVSDHEGNVDLSTENGNASIDQLKGDASLHLSGGSVSARNIAGNLQVEGTVDDGNISDVTGMLDFNAGYNGNLQLARISRPLHFKSVRTDLQLAKLDGEISMGHGDLRASSVSGPVKLTTRSNEVHLEDVSGEVTVENRNGTVELRARAPLGNIDISNVHGGIELDLPENANFRLDALSRGGNIDLEDFPINVDNNRTDATARGSVGKSGPDIRLRSDRGTIQIRKQ
jgi:DUF4097 and DUF4098 domain-containing protein YvlB